MLKVECESCKAPYQIDERRVPASGLRMRCPKCGQSFLVTNPDAAPAGEAGSLPPTRPSPKTMLGLNPAAALEATPSAPPRPGPPGPPPAAKKPGPPGPPPRPVAPKQAPLPPSRPAMPSDFPAALGGLGEIDLPSIQHDNLPTVVQVRGPTDLPTVVKRPTERPAPPAQPAVPDLPAPVAKPRAPQRAPSAPAFGELDFELPVVGGSDLPMMKQPREPSFAGPRPDIIGARGGDFGDLADLPSIGAGLPEISASLPAVAAGLPEISAGLPEISAGLPTIGAGLPSVAPGLPVVGGRAGGGPPAAGEPRGFGEIDLPTFPDPPPSRAPAARGVDSRAPGPNQQSVASIFGEFGELDLPRENSHAGSIPAGAMAREPSMAGASPTAGGFSAFDFGKSPGTADFSAKSGASYAGAIPGASTANSTESLAGGTGFGELDFGSNAGASIDTTGPVLSYSPPASELTASLSPPAPSGAPAGGVEAPIPSTAPRKRERAPRSRIGRAQRTRIALALAAAAIVGGAALQLTPHGAFAYLTISDSLRAKTYEAATRASIVELHTRLASDTYDGAKAAVDALANQHAAMPRAGGVAALAAFAEWSAELRFGTDTTRTPRAKTWLGEIPPRAEVPYKGAAQAAQAAAAREWDKARKLLDDATRRLSADPILLDLLLLRGEVELGGGNPTAAIAEFKKALEKSGAKEGVARAHYGLARAYEAAGDGASARHELDATIAESELHPGALVRRVWLDGTPTDTPEAIRSLATVIEGPAHAKASAIELSFAYATRGWLNLERGVTADARAAFDESVKLDIRDVVAQLGQGQLLFREGRFTEALTRFDTALSVAPNSANAIVSDARAKMALEHLADAKAQLAAAREKLPKSMEIALLLGQVEARLGNIDSADTQLRAALALADAGQKNAVQAYAALSSFLASRGMAQEAQTVLDEATRKLPPSSTLQRAFGELAEAGGQYAEAASRYTAALALDGRDTSTQFRLAVALRHLRKFEEASLALDHVQAMDKDFPGMALERGLLFEQRGDLPRAIEQFNAALAKAPGDPDLLLRVGSAYVTIGRPDDALPMLKSVLDKRPASAEANHFIGRAHLLKGPTANAIALRFLKRAVELDGNNAEYHMYLGWAANEAIPGQLTLAREEFDRALTLDKALADAYWQRGALRRKVGSIEDALRDETRALQLKPTRVEAHAVLAECYEEKNEMNAALEEWGRAVANSSDHPYWRFKYGRLLWERGQVGLAAPHLAFGAASGEKLEPRPAWVADAEFLTAEARRREGKNAEALEHYKRFLEIAPLASPDKGDAERAVAALSPK